MHIKCRLIAIAGVVTVALALLAGSVQAGSESDTAKVTVVLSAAADSLRESLLKAAVPKALIATNDIYSLDVSVTKIVLKRSGGDKIDDSSVVIFEGEQDVDLLELDALSQIFTSAEVPVGEYNKVILSVENPRLRLAKDPGTLITKVRIPADGRLFVNSKFEIVPDENNLIILRFKGLHLVRKGNRDEDNRGGGGGGGVRYILDPQLRARVVVTDADVSVTGEILKVKRQLDMLTMGLDDDDEVTVFYSGTLIYLPTDSDESPTGTEEHLVPGTTIDTLGVIDLDGVITANAIYIQ